jgi:hypothetical protein
VEESSMTVEAVGRILSATNKYARVEFGDHEIETGMLIEFHLNSRTITAKVETLESHKYSGLIGHVYFLDPIEKPPRRMTEVFMSQDFEEGVIYIGDDRRGLEIRINLNPLFSHLLVAGMTKSGKTHFMIVLLEALIALGVPCIVFDPHGEFINLAKTFPKKVVVVEDLRMLDLLSYARQRITVVYNLLGLHRVSKANRVAEIVSDLQARKEKDYMEAENDVRLLKIPPILVFVDEAELFAPNTSGYRGGQVKGAALDALVSLSKEGSKFGLGLIIAPQRVTRLHVDVRGQMNSSVLFRLIDVGSKHAIAEMDYISRNDMRAIGSFGQGECLITGSIVKRPRILRIKDIKTLRAKKIDFEEILGIGREVLDIRLEEQKLEITEQGIIDLKTGKLVETKAQIRIREDKDAFESDPGDGVVTRDTPLTDEELQELALPFETHLDPEDMKLIKELRKRNQDGDI